jgi:hypothetical protein
MSDHSSQYARDVLEQRWDDLQKMIDESESLHEYLGGVDHGKESRDRMKALQRELLLAMRCLHRELG